MCVSGCVSGVVCQWLCVSGCVSVVWGGIRQLTEYLSSSEAVEGQGSSGSDFKRIVCAEFSVELLSSTRGTALQHQL